MQKSEQRMKAICEYIEEYQFEYHRTPTMDLIAEAVGTVKSNVYKYLGEMEQRGMIDRNGRNIIVHSKVHSSPKLNRVPILGNVSCGALEYAEENFEEYVPLPAALFGEGQFFILRASGNSMIEAGIEPGDLVVVRKQATADDGDIIVALVDSETTLKRFFPGCRSKMRSTAPGKQVHGGYFCEELLYTRSCTACDKGLVDSQYWNKGVQRCWKIGRFTPGIARTAKKKLRG